MARVLISLPEEFLEEVDRLAREEKRSRSELIREGLRLLFQSRSFSLARARRAFQRMRLIAEKDSTGWNSLEEIRRWRNFV